MTRKFKNVHYQATNESINSVITGLDVHQDDTVLSVCGSGDIPFAIAERNPKRILVVDKDQTQLDYAEYRATSLKQGKSLKFLDIPSPLEIPIALAKAINPEWSFVYGNDLTNIVGRFRRVVYFLKDRGRLERIRKGLDKLEFVLGDIFELNTNEKFSRIYLSNTMPRGRITAGRGYSPTDKGRFDEDIKDYLQPQGLVYSCTLSFHPVNLKQDQNLTKKAQELSKSFGQRGWFPSVYRRVE